MSGAATYRCDVVVVGAGIGGAVSALAAAERGAEVLLLEKRPDVGGSTTVSSGLMAFTGTDEQKEAGIVDSLGTLEEDILSTGKYRNDRALVEAYSQHQEATYRWLKSHGVKFSSVHAGSGQAVARSHATDPSHTITRLIQGAQDRGVRVLTDAHVSRLTREGSRVTGVEGTIRGSACSITARRSVILATGGFTRNEEFLERHAPQMRAAIRGGGMGNTGDGLAMAAAVGADAIDFEFIKGTYGVHPFSGDFEPILAIYKGAVAVNAHGKRFIDESLPYKVIGDACLQQDAAGSFQIFDSATMQRSDPDVPIYDFEARLRRGEVVAAETLEELADLIEVDSTSLLETIERYNLAVSQGAEDEFGRQFLSGRVGTRMTISSPPFFAFPSTTVLLATYCGLRVAPDGAALTDTRTRIPGLFAVGEVTGGFHGDGYVTGTSLGKAAVFGRLAGSAAAGAS